MGRGIEMIRDPAAYKDSLMTKKDKWGETTCKPEEVKDAMNDPTAGTDAVLEDVEAEENKMPPPERHTNIIKLVSQFNNMVIQ